MKYYPAFINVTNRKAVVIGGGNVAERKVRSLVRAGAEVKVISPGITGYLAGLKDQGLIRHVKRNYRVGDVQGAFIVIAATSSAEVNAKVAQDADNLVNVVDPPSEGNLIVPSTVKRGPLTLAISTEGSSPAVSKAIRKEFEKNYNRDFGLYLRFVEKVRKQAVEKISDRKKREKFLKSLASRESFSTLRKEGFRALSKKVLSGLKK
jgi:precorrin-2 dehydrogenase/sirohydrochlorin ferrochelatase